ncbi:hypothetical protein [Sorangium sp. So ce1151]|uniref:hypothetical protein n=1 Tax=Sorangium sp. So ce1151 TaxID=3133332 RepID=UPI003F603895
MTKRVTGAALLAMLAEGSLTLAACGRSDDGSTGRARLAYLPCLIPGLPQRCKNHLQT